MIFQYGKHAGKHISEVPDGYLEWMVRDSEEKATVAKAELNRRKYKVDNSMMMKIITAGKDEVAKKLASDPDRKQLEAAFKLLEQAVIDAGKVEG